MVFFVFSVCLRKDLSSHEAFLLQGPPLRTRHSVGFGGIPFSDSNLHHLNGAGVVLFFSWCFSVGVYSKGCYKAL